MTSLQQTTFENIVTKEEIAKNDKFHLLPQSFQLFSVIIPSYQCICSRQKTFYQKEKLFMMLCKYFLTGKGLMQEKVNDRLKIDRKQAFQKPLQAFNL